MSTPFSLIWTDEFNNTLTTESFAICFPGNTSQAQQIQIRSNTAALFTFETLINVAFYLTGDADDINTVQNIWPTIGGTSNYQLKGGLDISFDFGRTYIRFDQTHGVKGDSSTWIPLPAEAVGYGAIAKTIGAFDTAHFLLRYVIPPNAAQFGKLNVALSIGFDII